MTQWPLHDGCLDNEEWYNRVDQAFHQRISTSLNLRDRSGEDMSVCEPETLPMVLGPAVKWYIRETLLPLS